MPADIVSNTYDLLNLRIQKDEGHLPVQEKIDITEDYLHSMTMDAHRCIKEQTKPSGAAKITCCGVELSKDILKKFANKIEKKLNNIQNIFKTHLKKWLNSFALMLMIVLR
ncbi:hypothetical protein HHJ47_20095 [Escherichia coli]|nr:hypothetical protein HHJ47_20095 [Escherichia coli]